jgi:hypothetical protein
VTLRPTEPTKTMAEAMQDITARLAVCQERYDNYDPKCHRRATGDSMYEVRRNLGAVDGWLKGENDTPVAWLQAAAGQEGRDAYRAHYAADALVAATHYILIAEFFAGLRSEDEAYDNDPWRYVDGKQQSEVERLRLAEGITFRFPRSVLS